MDFIRKIQELDIVKNIKKRRSERSDVVMMEKQSYGRTEIVASVFVVIWGTIVNALVFYVFWLTILTLSGFYHAPFSAPRVGFIAIAMIFGLLTSAATIFLNQCKKFKESSRTVFRRLTKKELETQEAKELIRRMRNHSNRPKYSLVVNQIKRVEIDELKREIAVREKELSKNSLLLLVLAGIAMVINWGYKQMLRYFAFLLICITGLIVIWEIGKGSGEDLHAIFSNINFVFGVFWFYFIMYFLIFMMRGMSRQQFVGGSSYFWKMLDEYELKRKGLLLSDGDKPFGEGKDDVILNRLQQQVKSNRKRGRSRQ